MFAFRKKKPPYFLEENWASGETGGAQGTKFKEALPVWEQASAGVTPERRASLNFALVSPSF